MPRSAAALSPAGLLFERMLETVDDLAVQASDGCLSGVSDSAAKRLIQAQFQGDPIIRIAFKK